MTRIYLFLLTIFLFGKRYLSLTGAQSVLGWFWPIMNFIGPLIVIYYSLGPILEISSPYENVSYRLFVLSGIVIWIPLTFIDPMFIKSWQSISKRKLLRVNLHSSWTIYFGNAIFQISAFALICVSLVVFSKNTLTQDLIFLFTILSFGLFVSLFGWAFGILSSLLRDFKFFVPYFINALLLVSPIFYANANANSGIEILIQNINPLVPLIEHTRGLLFESKVINLKFLVLLLVADFLVLTIYILKYREFENHFLKALSVRRNLEIDQENF